MPIDLITKFQPYVDEQFTTESKKALLANNDLSWIGAHTIRAFKVNTAPMNDYDRAGTNTENWSRYGGKSGRHHRGIYIAQGSFFHLRH